MRLAVFSIAMAAVLAGAGCSSPVDRAETAASRLDGDFARFINWFGGEYDNHEQVWQQRTDGLEGDALHEHIHHIFMPVQAPAIGEYTYFVKQYTDGDYEKVYRQRLYHFSKNTQENAIQLTIYSFHDAQRYRYIDREPQLARELTAAALYAVPGCEVYWQYNGRHFDGHMKEQACHFHSPRLNKTLYITDKLRLTDTEIWIADKAFDAGGNKIFGRDTPHKNRKVRYFTGWMGLQRRRIDAAADEKDWIFMQQFSIHNEGQIVPIIDAEGGKTGYSIQLARLTYQNTRQPILKLGLIEDASGKTLSYIWSEVGSKRLGMNLRWMQAGLTAVEP